MRPRIQKSDIIVRIYSSAGGDEVDSVCPLVAETNKTTSAFSVPAMNISDDLFSSMWAQLLEDTNAKVLSQDTRAISSPSKRSLTKDRQLHCDAKQTKYFNLTWSLRGRNKCHYGWCHVCATEERPERLDGAFSDLVMASPERRRSSVIVLCGFRFI